MLLRTLCFLVTNEHHWWGHLIERPCTAVIYCIARSSGCRCAAFLLAVLWLLSENPLEWLLPIFIAHSRGGKLQYGAGIPLFVFLAVTNGLNESSS